MNGSSIWYVQRLSALLLLGYVLWLSFFFITNPNLNFDAWVVFTGSSSFKIFTSSSVLFILLHSFIGLWTIGTDYFTRRTLGFLNMSLSRSADLIRNFYSVLFVLWGFLLTGLTLLIIWS